jgi:DNA-damage-inducible protein J
MSSTIQLRVEDESKKKTQNPYTSLSEDEILRQLEVSRSHASEGMYRDADDVIIDMREKYGL